MANIAIVQTFTGNSNSLVAGGSDYVNAMTVNAGINTAGNYLSLGIITSTQSIARVLSVTDTLGNTWVQRKAVAGTGSLNIGLYYFDCANCLGGTNIITITLTAASYDTVSAAGREYSGIVTSAQVDVSASNVDSGYGLTHNCGTTAATSQANELMIAMFGCSNPTTFYGLDRAYPGYTWNSPLVSSNVNASTPDYTGMAYSDSVATATGAQTATFSTGSDYIQGVGLIVCIKGVSLSVANPVPDAPLNVVSPTDSNRCYISWTAPKVKSINGFNTSTAITGFTVKRTTTSGSGYTTVAAAVANGFYDDISVTNGTTYYYVVTATSSGGTSVNSFETTAVVAALTAPHADQWYAYGAIPTGTSQTTILGYLRTHWNRCVSYMITQTGASHISWGAYRVKVPDQDIAGMGINNTVSEGTGYAIIGAVYMANRNNPQYDIKAQSYLNGLIEYYKFYGDKLDYIGSQGLMHWSIKFDGTVNPTTHFGATDGDIDSAFGMHMAHRLFGSTNGVDYLTFAKTLASQIQRFEFLPATYAPPNLIMNGDGWGQGPNIIYPDYFRPAYHDVFQYHSSDSRWATLKNSMWAWVSTYMTSVYNTGLVPDGCKRDGTQDNSFGASLNYSYNAIRIGFGYTLDYLWNGTAAAYNNQYKMASTAITRSGNSASNLGTTASLSSGASGSTNQVFASGYGSASTVSASTTAFAGLVANYITTQVSENSYFGLWQGFMNLLLMSGEMQPTFGAIPADPNPGTGNAPSTASFLLTML